jgi:hypothetical protein
MYEGPNFEEYLTSKKIDSQAFRSAELELWSAWKSEFEQIHPNSFTVQKLNLINPIRRKYLLQVAPVVKSPDAAAAVTNPPTPAKPGKPIMKPRPKFGPGLSGGKD